MNRIAIATLPAAALATGIVTPAANAASLEVHKNHCIVYPSEKNVKENDFSKEGHMIVREEMPTGSTNTPKMLKAF